MKNWKIPLYKVFADKEDVKHVSKVISRGMDWAIGPEIKNFEDMLAKYVGVDYCLTFNSGTSALHAALLGVGIKNKDEIVVPSFTFISTANSALMVNALPKFVDIEEETYGLNPILLEPKITKKTKVIMPIHYAGLPCKIQDLAETAKRKKIILIEDAAESLGARVGKKMVGSFGELAIVSFAGNKVLTTGEGGAILTNNKKLFRKLKLIRSHGRLDEQRYFSSNQSDEYVELGYNWRMSSITAALGTSQLKKFEKMIKLRRKNAKYLSSKLSKFDQIQVPNEPRNFRHVYQLYSIRLTSSKLRNNLMKFLTKKGIMSKVYFFPVHLTGFYKKMGYDKTKDLNITKAVSSEILSLPMYPGMQKNALNYIINCVSDFMKKN